MLTLKRPSKLYAMSSSCVVVLAAAQLIFLAIETESPKHRPSVPGSENDVNLSAAMPDAAETASLQSRKMDIFKCLGFSPAQPNGDHAESQNMTTPGARSFWSVQAQQNHC